MLSRLDRLMRLAQKTGDTLIIHDREGRDMVLLDVDRYENIVDEGYCDCMDDYEFHDMTEGEMLDKINRDIAIWRSHQEQNEQTHRARVLERDLVENPPPDPFEEDYSHASDWHKAGSVLEQRHPDLCVVNEYGRKDVDFEDFGDGIKFGKKYDDLEDNEIPDFGSPLTFNEDEEEWEELDGLEDEDIEGNNFVYDSLGEDSLYDTTRDKKDIPFVDHDSVETRKDDDEEPIFFEEPV